MYLNAEANAALSQSYEQNPEFSKKEEEKQQIKKHRTMSDAFPVPLITIL